MRIVLTTLNAKFIHSSLALRQLKQYCLRVCPDIVVKEYTINNELSHILGDLYRETPDVLGLACYIWNIDYTLALVRLLKKVLPQTIIILGGPEVSFDPDEIMRANPAVDYIVQGEGEEILAKLLVDLGSDQPSSVIEGLTQRIGNVVVSSKPQTIAELDTLPFPYDDKAIAELKDKIIYYESSRGCPFSCEYCLSGASPGVRFFTLERVLDDLAFFIRHDVRQVKFVDRTFNLRREHYWPILRFLAAADCRTNFHFEITAELLDNDILEFLRQVPHGRFQLEIGIQSTNAATLAAVSRKNDWPVIKKNVDTLQSGGNIHLHLDLIAGLPSEDYWRFGQSFNDVWHLQPDMLQLGFLKMLKGSGLRLQAAKHGYIYMDAAPYEVLANKYLTYGEIRRLKIIEELLNQLYNSGRFRTTCQWLVASYQQDAFRFYHDLADYWERRNLHIISHSGKALYQYLSDFCQDQLSEQSGICQQFLKFEALTFERGATRPAFLPWDNQWEEEKNSFWRDEAKARQYLPEYRFTTWREIKNNYHLEVFSCNIPDYLKTGAAIHQETTILLFDYRGRQTCYQQIAAADFRSGRR